MIRAKEIRAKARESMAGKWGRFVGMNFLYILTLFLIGLITMAPMLGVLGNAVGAIVDAAINQGDISEQELLNLVTSVVTGSGLTSLLSIVAMLIEVPLAYAVLENIMKAKRDNETTATYFFGRIFPNFGRAWKVTLWTLVKMIIPYLLFILGMIVVAVVAGILMAQEGFLAFLGGVLMLAGYVALMVWFIGKVLNLILGDYIAIDNPDLTAKEAVEKSIAIMPGHRWRYICLGLSFIGWAILSAFTLGIGDLFLTPYMAVADVVFYEEVLKDSGEAKTEPEPVAEPAPVEPTPAVEEPAPVVEETPVEEAPVAEEPTQE